MWIWMHYTVALLKSDINPFIRKSSAETIIRLKLKRGTKREHKHG